MEKLDGMGYRSYGFKGVDQVGVDRPHLHAYFGDPGRTG